MKDVGAVRALMVAMILAAPAAHAGDSSHSSSSSSSSRNNDNRSNYNTSSSNHDQDDAREALRRGKAMPLTSILEIAFRRERGMVLEVELETNEGKLVYNIELLTDSGRKVEMWINARTGDILKVRYP